MCLWILNSQIYYNMSFLYSMVQQALVRQGLLVINASRSHTDTPYSVGLLWTSDQPDAEIYTRQHTTQRRDRHPCPRRNSNQESQQVCGTSDPRFRPRGHSDRHLFLLAYYSYLVLIKLLLSNCSVCQANTYACF